MAFRFLLILIRCVAPPASVLLIKRFRTPGLVGLAFWKVLTMIMPLLDKLGRVGWALPTGT